MSATYRECDQRRVSQCLGIDRPDAILRGDLSRRGITFLVDVSGAPANAIRQDATQDLIADPHSQQIWYTNSKTNAEGSLLQLADTLLEEKNEDNECAETVAMSLTGADGIMQKVYVMDSFTSYSPPGCEDDVESELPRNQITVATSAANAGISSKLCTKSRHKGLPPDFYDLVQEMGRVDRLLSAVPGSNKYVVHISLNCYASLFIRCMRVKSPSERRIQLMNIHRVLRFLVTPDECYHTHIERYFEEDSFVSRGDCGDFCSYCKGDIESLTGLFSRKLLISVLTTEVFENGKPPLFKYFMKKLKEHKEAFFHVDHVPNLKMRSLHALCLQLIAKGIVQLDTLEAPKIGTDKFGVKDVVVFLGNGVDDDGVTMPAYSIRSKWKGLTTYD
mmetsp:Transcript_15257/g.32285  ORF Transcript_15257/g.32285 Transcript_15257/m.32285 type:complete len:390 (+) Transcript_15257:1064-2233(+)